MRHSKLLKLLLFSFVLAELWFIGWEVTTGIQTTATLAAVKGSLRDWHGGR